MADGRDIDASIDELEAAAEVALHKKREMRPRKPLVIEFAGSPKSGKSSCIYSLAVFLKRNGFNTAALTEQASVCPIKGKFDPLFNIWTANNSLKHLIEVLDRDARNLDIVLMDRGLFDALIWFEWQNRNNFLRQEDYTNFIGFFTTSRFRMMTDLVYLFEANPELSIEREYKNLLTRKEGSIMRRNVLQGYIEAAGAAVEKYGSNFRKIKRFNTDQSDQNQVSYRLTDDVIKAIDVAAHERIGYVGIDQIDEALPEAFPYSEIENVIDSKLTYDDRQIVETRKDFLQFIPVAVIKDAHSDRVLAGMKSRKMLNDDSPELGKVLLWFGGHLREDDQDPMPGSTSLSALKQCLYREIKEEIGVDISADHVKPKCIWVRDNEKSARHLAVVFFITLDLETVKITVDDAEFVRGEATADRPLKTVEPISYGQIVQFGDLFDSWSKNIARCLVNGELHSQAMA